MKMPCRLEFNAAGSWKLLTKFDAALDAHTDSILLEAGHLVDAINEASAASGTIAKGATLRVTTDDAMPDVLMRYETGYGWIASPGARALLMEARKASAGVKACISLENGEPRRCPLWRCHEAKACTSGVSVVHHQTKRGSHP